MTKYRMKLTAMLRIRTASCLECAADAMVQVYGMDIADIDSASANPSLNESDTVMLIPWTGPTFLLAFVFWIFNIFSEIQKMIDSLAETRAVRHKAK